MGIFDNSRQQPDLYPVEWVEVLDQNRFPNCMDPSYSHRCIRTN